MNLGIFLTGQKSPNLASTPLESLGYYPSITQIEDEVIGNLFPAISKYTIQTNKPETRAIVLKNVGLTTITDLRLWFIYPSAPSGSDEFDDQQAIFKVGYTALTTDACGDLIFPNSITNPYGSPLGITFVEADAEENAISLPDIEAGMYLGIWIKRTLDPDLQLPLDSETLCEISAGTLVLDKTETTGLHLDWTE